MQFTQRLRLRSVYAHYAEFTQGLRRFTQVYTVLIHALSCVNLTRDFTDSDLRKVYAGLRI
jgi:hypothetical protein